MESRLNIWTPERIEKAHSACFKWLGTPHRDRVAVCGKGVDCINFVHQILVAAGILEPARFSGYTLHDGLWDYSDKLERVFMHVCFVEPVEKESPQFGDIAVFRTGGRSGHCGFATGEDLFHALSGRRVTKSRYSFWMKEIKTLFRLKETG